MLVAGVGAAIVIDSKQTVYLHPDVVVSNGDIAKASAQRNRKAIRTAWR